MKEGILLPRPKHFFVAVMVVAITSTATLLWVGKAELIPQFWVCVVALALSYFACVFTIDKLRLDLFDRRFEIYSQTLTYCSVILAHASLSRNERNKEDIDAAVKAAHDSFRGVGIHKTHALFGKEISDKFKELSDSFAYILTYGGDRSGDRDFDAAKYWAHIEATVGMIDELPSLFRPYMYFGDHRVD